MEIEGAGEGIGKRVCGFYSPVFRASVISDAGTKVCACKVG